MLKKIPLKNLNRGVLFDLITRSNTNGSGTGIFICIFRNSISK